MDEQNFYRQALRDILMIEVCEQNKGMDSGFSQENNYNFQKSITFSAQSSNKHAHYQISNYINPLFLGSNQYQRRQGLDETLTRNKKISSISNNTGLLLESVKDMPKLRYQQSQQNFKIKHQDQNPDEQQIIEKSITTPLKLPHVTFDQNPSFQSKQQNLKIGSNSKTINQLSPILKQPHSSNYLMKKTGKSGTKQSTFFSGFSSQKKTLHKDQFEQEPPSMALQELEQLSLIGANQRLYAKNTEYKMLNRSGKLLEPQKLERKQINRQKNFIQTYFQSAKHKISQGFSLDCCCDVIKQEKKEQKKPQKTMQKMQHSHIVLKK